MSEPQRDFPPTDAEVTGQTVTDLQEQIWWLTSTVQALSLQVEESGTKDNPLATMELGFNFELPEFHGTQSADELLAWMVTVEETLEFKSIPLDQCVPIIAMRFRGSAAAWWLNLKTCRARLGKPKILSWDKLKKKMRKTFLPLHYKEVILQRLYDLQQGRRSLEEYSNEFVSLLRRVDLQPHDVDQAIVGYFVGGLGQKFQNYLNFQKPNTVDEAHEHALMVEAMIPDQ